MARGWESKSVESQREDRIAERDEQNRGAESDTADAERLRKRESLEMSRKRIARELGSAQSEVHRAALQNALTFLDAELQKLGAG